MGEAPAIMAQPGINRGRGGGWLLTTANGTLVGQRRGEQCVGRCADRRRDAGGHQEEGLGCGVGVGAERRPEGTGKGFDEGGTRRPPVGAV